MYDSDAEHNFDWKMNYFIFTYESCNTLKSFSLILFLKIICLENDYGTQCKIWNKNFKNYPLSCGSGSPHIHTTQNLAMYQ